jgi:ferredoxin-nitrite reductase
MVPAVRRSDGSPGFNVMVGGKMGSGGMTLAQPLDAFVGPKDAARLAAEITLLFRDEGAREKRTKARLAFLVDDWGIDRFRATLEERWGRPLEAAQQDARTAETTDHLGIQPQRLPGLNSVGLAVPTGRVSAENLEDLALLADRYGTGEVRLTTGQNVIIVNVAEQDVPGLLSEPLLQEFSPEPHPFLRGLITCTGTDYCNLALIETKQVGKKLTEKLVEQFPQGFPVRMHWSGCPAGCANHQAADIGFQGGKTRVDGRVVDAVSIFVGGRSGTAPKPGQKVMEQVPLDRLGEVVPGLLKDLKSAYKQAAHPQGDLCVTVTPAFAGVQEPGL